LQPKLPQRPIAGVAPPPTAFPGGPVQAKLQPARIAPPPTAFGAGAAQAKPQAPSRSATAAPPTAFATGAAQAKPQARTPAGIAPPATAFAGGARQAKPAAVRPPAAAPPPLRPAGTSLQPKPALPAARPPAPLPPSPQRSAVVQRMIAEDVDELTDDEEELEYAPAWVHFTDRPKMPTLYSYAKAQGGNPVTNEGPHSVASLAYRRIFEDIVARDSWEDLQNYYNHLPDRAGLKDIIRVNEEVSKENNDKLALYYSDYERQYDTLSNWDELKANEAIDEIALEVWKLANLQPYASLGWKSALASGKGVSGKSSAGKTEREGVKYRQGKGVLSVRHSVLLVDGPFLFKDTDAVKKYVRSKFKLLFKSKLKADRLMTYIPQKAKMKKELEALRKKKRAAKVKAARESK
jgi:hypothetical protein